MLVLLCGCKARPLRVAAAGDLQPGGAPADPLGALPDLLVGDVRLLNLESPLTTRGRERGLDADGRPRPGEAIRFQAPPARAAWLKGRVDVVSLANNHALDQGEAGREDTARALADVGVRAAWRGHDVRLGRVTVVARDAPEPAEVEAAVRDAARRGPVLVSLHWGRAGALLPDAAQRALAARLVDAGAAAVLGHGPHTPQGIERRGRGVIAYSLGNVAFGCRCTDATDAYALTFTLDAEGGAVDVRARPFRAGLQGPVSTDADEGLYELLANLSEDLGARVTRDGAFLRIE